MHGWHATELAEHKELEARRMRDVAERAIKEAEALAREARCKEAEVRWSWRFKMLSSLGQDVHN